MNNNQNGTFGFDDQNRGHMDRAVDAGTSAHGITQGVASPGVISAIFDSNEEAQHAVSELRKLGVNDADLSLIAQAKGTMTTREGGGEITDEEHSNVLRGILGGGALGAGLGVAALAIPGVGPLAALGAIAATVVPEAMAIGAVAGAAAGTFNESLKKHGVSDDDAAYYGDRLKGGGVLVTANASGLDREQAQEVLYRNGGHSAARARSATI
ncbi:hypothetical protein [Sphingomonas sp. M1-B02]|uniref:hypothetical protein n=1 Tax=Sphingomonas sp. M1-B02 TaxID=3114300 RepID=UPI00223E9C8E|nr:hypothetical protein [Sphingomonas sp. S6-11]UZK67813.1 hypothetical protein OKW87_08305 [Sphingomonas sp. S6-11]